MERLSRDPLAFIRPSPSQTQLGGVARRSREALLVCEAAGFDIVLVETVGVGQSETAVAGMTDLFLLLLVPGGGDELQGIKRGIVELADLVLVNKADGDLAVAAERAVEAYRNALTLLRPRSAGWDVPVAGCSSVTGAGIAAAWDAMRRYRETLTASGELAARRAGQAGEWLWAEPPRRCSSASASTPACASACRGSSAQSGRDRCRRRSAHAVLIASFPRGERQAWPHQPRRDRRPRSRERAAGLCAAPWRNRFRAALAPGAPGVTVVFVALPNTKIELVTPLGERSPLRSFIEKNPGGGIHHLSLEVPDVRAA